VVWSVDRCELLGGRQVAACVRWRAPVTALVTVPHKSIPHTVNSPNEFIPSSAKTPNECVPVTARTPNEGVCHHPERSRGVTNPPAALPLTPDFFPTAHSDATSMALCRKCTFSSIMPCRISMRPFIEPQWASTLRTGRGNQGLGFQLQDLGFKIEGNGCGV